MRRGNPRRGGAPKKLTRHPDGAARVGTVALAAGLLGTALAVDAAADSAFDAPKRLVALIAIAVAAAAIFGRRPRRAQAPEFWQRLPRASSAALALWLVALAAGGAAAVLSPRREVAMDSYRALLLYAVLLPLGASRAMRDPRLLLGVFLAATGVNAGVSLLQATGAFSPFTIRAWGGREATGAFAGNVGYLAITLALAAVAAIGVFFSSRSRQIRVASGAGALLFLACLLVNQNLTSLAAFAAGGVVLVLLTAGRRAWLALAIVFALMVAGVALYKPLRVRASQAASAVAAGDWDRLLTYRAGPWAATVEMTRERPWTGWGPGTFAQEFVPHRLSAEIRARRRFVNPLVTSSYGEAHSDYLQPFAEAGVLGGLAAAAAGLLLIVSLLRSLRRMEGARRREAIIVAAMLVAGATAALTWFPFQRPVTALPLLLAAGRGWKLTGEAEE